MGEKRRSIKTNLLDHPILTIDTFIVSVVVVVVIVVVAVVLVSFHNFVI